MTIHSQPVWKMAKDALKDLGGDQNWIQLINIVNKIHERWPSVNGGTIRCQVRIRCVNGHPGHDEYPDKGKMWRTQPTFISNKSGKYRLYNKERDYIIYLAALKEDGFSTDVIPEITKQEIKITPPSEMSLEVSDKENIPIHNPIDLLESYGNRLGFQTQREWPVPLGRIDLVWYKEIQIMLPQTETTKYPLVGFEIETSWRTRKHIKGDIINFQSLKAPIGIILQQTSDDDYPSDVENFNPKCKGFPKRDGKYQYRNMDE